MTTPWPRAFVDSFKTELITDRVWTNREELELALIEYVGWFNHDRIHESRGDIPPAEFEALNAPRNSSTMATHHPGSPSREAQNASQHLDFSAVERNGPSTASRTTTKTDPARRRAATPAPPTPVHSFPQAARLRFTVKPPNHKSRGPRKRGKSTR